MLDGIRLRIITRIHQIRRLAGDQIRGRKGRIVGNFNVKAQRKAIAGQALMPFRISLMLLMGYAAPNPPAPTWCGLSRDTSAA